MIVLHCQGFRVATYHRKMNPGHADVELSQGLILEVCLTFEFWLDGQPLRAEAFLDPGADHTLVSRRWIAEQAADHRATRHSPKTDPEGRVLEGVQITIGGWRAPVGATGKPIWLFDQEYGSEDADSLPGYEDLLLGRDFLSQHGLLVVIDGEGRTFSVLDPGDAENRERRDQILALLTPSQL